jgi:hypothetical protein
MRFIVFVVGLALTIVVGMHGVIADGPPGPRRHTHPPGQDWILKGGHRNAAGEWCCGEGDCFLVPPEQVELRGNHYVLFGAERVPSTEAQPSPDGAFWRCKRPDGSRRCFFAPPPGA